MSRTVLNTTKKNDFMKLLGENKVSINKINENTYKLSDDTFNHLEWILEVEEENYILSCKDEYEEFQIYLTMEGNNTTITKACQNGKTYKSDKYFKKFSYIMMFANCFVYFGIIEQEVKPVKEVQEIVIQLEEKAEEVVQVEESNNEEYEKIIKEGNTTKYYLGGRLSLTITKLENDCYSVEGVNSKLIGYCKTLNKYQIENRLDENYINRNGKWHKTKKLFNHNESWFAYILQEKGFVPKIVAIR
jgi:hypothetical protein